MRWGTYLHNIHLLLRHGRPCQHTGNMFWFYHEVDHSRFLQFIWNLATSSQSRVDQFFSTKKGYTKQRHKKSPNNTVEKNNARHKRLNMILHFLTESTVYMETKSYGVTGYYDVMKHTDTLYFCTQLTKFCINLSTTAHSQKTSCIREWW